MRIIVDSGAWRGEQQPVRWQEAYPDQPESL
jgi:hypothetical protein